MKVGIFSSWVSLVQKGSFNDQIFRQLTETTTIITGNTAVIIQQHTLRGEILCNANMELFKTFILLRPFCISGSNKRCRMPLLQHLTSGVELFLTCTHMPVGLSKFQIKKKKQQRPRSLRESCISSRHVGVNLIISTFSV